MKAPSIINEQDGDDDELDMQERSIGLGSIGAPSVATVKDATKLVRKLTKKVSLCMDPDVMNSTQASFKLKKMVKE